jgi:hypothetical protein
VVVVVKLAICPAAQFPLDPQNLRQLSSPLLVAPRTFWQALFLRPLLAAITVDIIAQVNKHPIRIITNNLDIADYISTYINFPRIIFSYPRNIPDA